MKGGDDLGDDFLSAVIDIVVDLFGGTFEEIGIDREGDECEQAERYNVKYQVEGLDWADVALSNFVFNCFAKAIVNILSYWIFDETITDKFAPLGIES